MDGGGIVRKRGLGVTGREWSLVDGRRSLATPAGEGPTTADQRPEISEHIAGACVTFLVRCTVVYRLAGLWNPLPISKSGYGGLLCAAAASHFWLRFAMLLGKLSTGYSSFNSYLQLPKPGARLPLRARCGAWYWTPRERPLRPPTSWRSAWTRESATTPPRIRRDDLRWICCRRESIRRGRRRKGCRRRFRR